MPFFARLRPVKRKRPPGATTWWFRPHELTGQQRTEVTFGTGRLLRASAAEGASSATSAAAANSVEVRVCLNWSLKRLRG
jgi:hypothetical protein